MIHLHLVIKITVNKKMNACHSTEGRVACYTRAFHISFHFFGLRSASKDDFDGYGNAAKHAIYDQNQWFFTISTWVLHRCTSFQVNVSFSSWQLRELAHRNWGFVRASAPDDTLPIISRVHINFIPGIMVHLFHAEWLRRIAMWLRQREVTIVNDILAAVLLVLVLAPSVLVLR